MNEYRNEALKKLREGAKNVKGQKENAMKEAVRATLETFCTQDEEFAQAVVQGGDFPSLYLWRKTCRNLEENL